MKVYVAASERGITELWNLNFLPFMLCLEHCLPRHSPCSVSGKGSRCALEHMAAVTPSVHPHWRPPSHGASPCPRAAGPGCRTVPCPRWEPWGLSPAARPLGRGAGGCGAVGFAIPACPGQVWLSPGCLRAQPGVGLAVSTSPAPGPASRAHGPAPHAHLPTLHLRLHGLKSNQGLNQCQYICFCSIAKKNKAEFQYHVPRVPRAVL